MAKKHALLIANTEYRDGRLAPLAHPGLAFAELAEALKDPARGAFNQVETLVNANLSHVLNTLDRFFSRKPADAVLLVYVGGHGFVDPQGELFLALKESDRLRLKSTALMAAVLGMNMDQCPSPHKVLILDCHYHPSLGAGQPDGRPAAPVRIEPARVFAGRGLPKLILQTGETSPGPAPRPPSPTATPVTGRIPLVGRDFTRTLAECLRTPSGAPGARSAYTVEDWWSDASAELRAARAEAPSRHAVGQPPMTVLRGASLPRPELALSGHSGDTSVVLPLSAPEPEGDWSRLSGIFPLEMIAPELAPARALGEPSGADLPPGEAAEDLPADSGLPPGHETRLELALAVDDLAPEEPAPPRPAAFPHAVLGRGDETLIADRRYLEGGAPGVEAPAEAATDAALPPPAERTLEMPSGSARDAEPAPSAADAAAPASPSEAADAYARLRDRLKVQEEEEQAARLRQEREEAAQRERLDQWKQRWNARSDSRGAPGTAEAPAAGPTRPEAPPPEPPGPRPKRTAYQARAAAMQKTLLIDNPDAEPGSQSLRDPAAAPAAGAPAPLAPGMATVMVPKDQFLNTGSHKAATPLTPGATIIVSREEFLGHRSGSETQAAEPAPAPSRKGKGKGKDKGQTASAPKAPAVPSVPPSRGDDQAPAGSAEEPVSRPGGHRRALLWALAGLIPVGLCLLVFFGAKSGLFRALGLGEAPAPRAAAPRSAPVTPPEAPVPAARPPSALPPAAGTAGAPDAADAADADAPVTPSAAPAADVTRPAALPDPAPAAALKATPPAPPAPERTRKPAPAAPTAAARALEAEERVARARYRQDSLRAYQRYRDSLLTARAQSKQDSLALARLARDAERALAYEAKVARAAALQARRDSLRAHADDQRGEKLLRSSVAAAQRADADGLRGLYNRFALGYPGLQGDVVIQLLVAPDGEIERGNIVSSSTGLPMFDQVVLGNVMDWKLRRFPGPASRPIAVTLKFPLE